MRLNQLYESVSSTLFHFTTFVGAYKILRSDTLKTHTGNISFSRSVTGNYPITNKMIGVYFVVDGNKLNQTYKGSAHGGEDYEFDSDGKLVSVFTGKSGQLEDRVFAKEIKNFSNYVNKIIVFVDYDFLSHSDEDELDNVYKDNLDAILMLIPLLEQLKVPIVLITRTKDLPQWRVAPRISPNDLLKFVPRHIIKLGISGETDLGFLRETERSFTTIKSPKDIIESLAYDTSLRQAIKLFKLPVNTEVVHIRVVSVNGEFKNTEFTIED